MNPEIKKILENIDAILISSHSNIIYFTNYSGFSETERECFLIITDKQRILITDKRYSYAFKTNKHFKVIDSGVGMFLKTEAKKIFKQLNIKTLGIEEDNLTVSEFKLLKNSTKLESVNLRKLRILKNPKEIENIKLACAITDKAFGYILKKFKLGISEKEISNLTESFIRNKGAEISFKPIVAFGKNSAIPHHQTGNTKLLDNQIILLDFGVKINNYCSDMSRTIFFGKAPEKFKKMHDIVLEAQKKSINLIKENINASLIDQAAREYIKAKKFSNIIHSVGHGIGLEVHEAPFISPNSKDIIKNNMIFSIEPGIYEPSFGGIRIEDLVLVREGKAELIYKSNRGIIEL